VREGRLAVGFLSALIVFGEKLKALIGL